MNAPERIYLDGDVEVGDGVFLRCFENPKYASEPPVEYIRADLVDPAAIRAAALRETADMFGPIVRDTILALIDKEPKHE